MVDLRKLGFDGNEPDFMQKMRETMLADAGLGRFLTEDPIMAKYVQDGMYAMKEADEILNG